VQGHRQASARFDVGRHARPHGRQLARGRLGTLSVRLETKQSLVRHTDDAVGLFRSGEMCEKCVEIDKTIERYRNILRSIRDEATVEGTMKLIADLEVRKAALHPERDQ